MIGFSVLTLEATTDHYPDVGPNCRFTTREWIRQEIPYFNPNIKLKKIYHATLLNPLFVCTYPHHPRKRQPEL
jgi:hypothetical protein